MEHYIANKKVLTVIGPLDQKTPAGNEMVKVAFEDGTEEIMPKTRFELIVTEEKSDATVVQNKLKMKVGAMLFSVLHEYGIKMGETNDISDAMIRLVNTGYEKARDIKFGSEFLDLPLIEVNKILLENATNKQDINRTSPVGGGTNNGDQE